MWSPKKATVNCINCVNGDRPTSVVSDHADANGTEKTLRPVWAPAAVVGMACRLPGNVTSPSKLWDLCANGPGRDESPSPTPTLSDRSGVDSAYYTDSPGDSSPRRKTRESNHSSNEDSSLFNGDFLGVSVDKLNALESETRVLLKTVYEATENAGIPIESLGGTSTSVFTGYGEDRSCPHVFRAKESSTSGISSTQLSSSISHLFNLRGPSMSIDTGCSSGLVCLHQAYETIRSGESHLSIVGAVDKSFGSSHSSSSAAALVLKSLDAALRDGDRVHCVIKATGLNHNGRAEELSTESEKKLVQDVYQRACLSPGETVYLESNLPDARDLAGILGDRSKADDPVLVGSVAADLGHNIGPVQGLAGIIKGAFAIQNRQTQPVNKSVRASIHNTGCGGTNAHVILETPQLQPTTQPDRTYIENEPPSHVFLLSAEDANTTRAMAKNLGTNLRKSIEVGKNISLADLAYTLAERRSRLSSKAVIRARSLEELIDTLDRPDLKIRATGPSKRRLGFVFNGQGAQWHAMGRELLSSYPVFALAIKDADGILRGFGADWSLEEELTRDAESTRVSEINISQPSTVALQLALVNLLRSWNVSPSAVVSHSTGEFAAAYAAGALSFSQALGIVYHLGDLARKYYGGSQSGAGGMAAAAISANEVEKYLIHTSAGGKVVVACINSPKSVTLSGDTDDLDEVLKRLDDDGVFARKLKVPLAYHSHHMLSFEAEYTERLRQLFSPSSKSEHTSLDGGQVVYVSPVTGDVVTSPQEVLTPEYYVRNITSPVLFNDAFKAFSEHVDEVVEIGPHSTLSGPIREILRETAGEELDMEYMTCLKRPVDAIQTVQDLACDLLTLGYPVSLRDVNRFSAKDQKLNFVRDLPSYPWSGHISGALTPETDDSSPSQSEGEDVITTSTLSWELDISHNIPDQIKDTMRINLSQDEVDGERTLKRASYYLISDAVQELQKHAPESWTPHQKETLESMVATVELGKQGGFGPGSALWSRATPGMKQLLYDELHQGKYGAAGELIAQLGLKLADIVRDKIAPAGLANETNELIHRYYTEVPMLKSRTYKHLSQVTELFALKNPGAKVLEIGGVGAGGVTRVVLEAFGSRSNSGGTLLGGYVFTHKDPKALEIASRYLSSWDLDDDSFIEYKTLDIEQELSDSFPAGTFDLIVASLALSDQERDLNKTFLNAKRLLKPGGRLFLVGTSRDRLDVELISRTVSGYPSSVPVEVWDKTLRDTGFTGVDFEIGDCEQTQYQSSSFIMSTATPDTAPRFPPAVSVLYTTPIPGSWHERFAGAIRENIPDISVVKAENWDTFEPPAEGDESKIYILTGDVASSGSFVEGTNETSFVRLQRLAHASQRVLWLSQGGVVDAQEPSYATALAFLSNFSRLDVNTAKRFVHLDLETRNKESWDDVTIDHIVHVLRATMDDNVPLSDVDREYTVKDGMLHVPRVLPVDRDATGAEEISVTDKLFTKPDSTALLVGSGSSDSGGIVEELALWLVDQGVRNLAVASTGSQPEALLGKIDAGKCNIQFQDSDLSSEPGILELLNTVGSSSSMPPIRGVIVIDSSQHPHDNASGLQTSLSSFDQWKQSAVQKGAAIRNLDTSLPSDLDFFVLLSTFDHSLANVQILNSSFQHLFARNRATAGRPITNVYLPIGHRSSDRINDADATSTTTLSVPDLLSRAISDAIRNLPVSPQDSQIIVGLPRWNKLPADSPLRTDPRFKTLQLGVQRKRRDTISSSEAAQRSSPSDLLLQALEGSDNGEDRLAQALQAQLAVLLRIQAAEEIDLSKPLATYGVDSIVAIELRSWLADTTEGKAKLSVLEILNADSLHAVAKMVSSRARKGQSVL